ncbi:MAG TPA: translation initiation factor IF-3 [Candidatus Saccharimonadales bacterium]|nr:translation initiation factor IF-3 [Candidatus Saccharimonadales bacterium]
MSRPFPSRSSAPSSFVRVNGKIRAREVRVIGDDGNQLGVHSLPDAINMARAKGVDLVEIAPNATPPVCRLVDFGKYRYEQSKKEKEAKKHQHANKVKEIQLSPSIDPHDFGVKLQHAINFLCDEMKVKVTLRFRGREMAHKEFGFQQVEKFIKEVAPFGHPDAPAKLIGKGINVMLSPLPRNKRAKNPREGEPIPDMKEEVHEEDGEDNEPESELNPAEQQAAAESNAPLSKADLRTQS